MDDLFGLRPDRVRQFQQKFAKPRRKSSWTPAHQVAETVAQKVGVSLSPEAVDRIRRRRAEDYYQWASSELKRWQGRMPEAEWLKMQAHVQSLKPEP